MPGRRPLKALLLLAALAGSFAGDLKTMGAVKVLITTGERDRRFSTGQISGGVLDASPVHAVRLVRANQSPASWTRNRRRRMATVYQTTWCDPDHSIRRACREESGPRSGSID